MNAIRTKPANTEEEPNQTGEQVFTTSTDFVEKPITLGEQVFATYPGPRKLFVASQQFPCGLQLHVQFGLFQPPKLRVNPGNLSPLKYA